MKEPKEFKYPRVYVRLGNDFNTRIRIVRPNGEAEWGHGYFGFYEEKPCWNENAKYGKKAVKLMKAYDEKWGFETVFLGEIK